MVPLIIIEITMMIMMIMVILPLDSPEWNFSSFHGFTHSVVNFSQEHSTELSEEKDSRFHSPHLKKDSHEDFILRWSSPWFPLFSSFSSFSFGWRSEITFRWIRVDVGNVSKECAESFRGVLIRIQPVRTTEGEKERLLLLFSSSAGSTVSIKGYLELPTSISLLQKLNFFRSYLPTPYPLLYKLSIHPPHLLLSSLTTSVDKFLLINWISDKNRHRHPAKKYPSLPDFSSSFKKDYPVVTFSQEGLLLFIEFRFPKDFPLFWSESPVTTESRSTVSIIWEGEFPNMKLFPDPSLCGMSFSFRKQSSHTSYVYVPYITLNEEEWRGIKRWFKG